MTAPVGSVPGTLIDWAAGVIGIPSSVVSAQITLESGGKPNALSPTGAQGVAQFEPGTWQAEGCTGSPDNVNDGMKCYAKLMYQLVQQYHGNVRDALAAYNAGSQDISAGYGYADTILANAGQSSTLTSKGGTGNANSGSGTTSTAAVAAAQSSLSSTCVIGFGGIPGTSFLNDIFGSGGNVGQFCILSKSEVRALLGGLLLVAGGMTAMVGVLILAAYGLKQTGALGKAADVAAVIPGGQMAAVGLKTAQNRASQGNTDATRRATAPVRRQEARQADYERRRRDEAAGGETGMIGRRPGDPFRYATPRED